MIGNKRPGANHLRASCTGIAKNIESRRDTFCLLLCSIYERKVNVAVLFAGRWLPDQILG